MLLIDENTNTNEVICIKSRSLFGPPSECSYDASGQSKRHCQSSLVESRGDADVVCELHLSSPRRCRQPSETEERPVICGCHCPKVKRVSQTSV